MVAHSVYYCKLIYCAEWKESFAIYITLTGDTLSSHPRPVCRCITFKFSIKWNHPPPWCHYISTNWVSPVVRLRMILFQAHYNWNLGRRLERWSTSKIIVSCIIISEWNW